MKYYIAYGSNLNVRQMGYRCPSAKIVTTGVLKNWRLLFKGSLTGSYLTIERAKGYEVPVAVWSVTNDDIARLDAYEGYPAFYYRKSFILACDDGKTRAVFGYIMHENRKVGIPSKFYVETCAEGYADFGFDNERLIEALEHSKEVELNERVKIG